MINRKGENYKDELDLAEEGLEASLATFTEQVARASYIEGVEDALHAMRWRYPGIPSPEQIRKELLGDDA